MGGRYALYWALLVRYRLNWKVVRGIEAVLRQQRLIELRFNVPPDKIDHFGDILPSQSLGILLMRLQRSLSMTSSPVSSLMLSVSYGWTENTRIKWSELYLRAVRCLPAYPHDAIPHSVRTCSLSSTAQHQVHWQYLTSSTILAAVVNDTVAYEICINKTAFVLRCHALYRGRTSRWASI